MSYWQIISNEFDVGYIDASHTLLCINCPNCTTWALGRFLPIFEHEAIHKFASTSVEHRSFAELEAVCNALHSSGVRCPYRNSRFTNTALHGFAPGDHLGKYIWKRAPKNPREIEFPVGSGPVVRDLLSMLTRCDCLTVSFEGVWFAPVVNCKSKKDSDLHAMIFDDTRWQIQHPLLDLKASRCSICGREIPAKPIPEVMARRSYVKKTLNKNRIVPEQLTNSMSDAFCCDYADGMFISDRLHRILADSFKNRTDLIVRPWDTTPDICKLLPKLLDADAEFSVN